MAEQDALFVKSKVRDYIKGKGCNTAGDVIETQVLNEKIIAILDDAIERAKANGRKTVKARDI